MAARHAAGGVKALATAPPYAVEVEGVSKRFGAQPALDGVTLKIRRGEVYGILGPNGAGKTTLIRALVGLIVPDGGTITVLGQRMPSLDILARVGYMTQQAALYPDLSAGENVRFFAEIYGAHDGVREALEFVDLWDRRDSVVSELSGGMRTRCSLACALVHKPDLLLLDEPTVGVDPQLRVQLWDRFQRMAREGKSILVSSHVMDEAERSDRLGLIRFGRLLAEGTVAELKRKAGVERLEDAFLKLSEASPQ
jgi:ABC-2 type transport system ATP-binding protein